MWRNHVYAHELLTLECQTVLDEVEALPGVKISREGLIRITEPIGRMVPYELCPKGIKALLRKITAEGTLPREAFKTNQAYSRALCNLYIYGYMEDVPATLLERRRYHNALKKRWGLDNPEKLAEYRKNAQSLHDKHRAETSRI